MTRSRRRQRATVRPPTQPPEMKLLTVKEVAQMLSFSKTKVYGMAGKELRCYKIGGAIRFSEAR